MTDRAAASALNQVKYSSVPNSPAEEAGGKNGGSESFNLIIDDSIKSPSDDLKTKKRPKFLKGKKHGAPKPPSDEKDVTSLQLFRYSDCLDKLLILFGVVSAFLAAGIYPLMFLMYGQVAGTLVDYQKYRIINGLAGNMTTMPSFLADDNSTNSSNFCFKLSKMDTNFDARIAYSIRFYLVVGVLSLIVNYLAHVSFNTAAERQVKRIRNKLFESLVRQEMAFFDKNSPGELNSILTGNLSLIQLGIGFKVADFISMLGRGLGCSILAIFSAWKFSVVFLAIMPFIVFTTMMTVIMIKKYTVLEFKAYGSAGRIAQEVLSSIRTVVSLGMQKRSIKTYEENLHVAESMSSKKGFLTGLFGGLSTGLFNLCFAVGIYYATYLARTDCQNYYPGNLMLSFFAIVTTTFSIGQALPYLRDLSEARGAAKRVFHIIEKKSEIDVFTSRGVSGVDVKGSIEFENVTFSYPQRPGVQVLQGLSLRIPAGKTVAFCGSSGGGKSTVIALLQRFYLQSSGTIKIDGKNIDDYELGWLRSQMALVSQEPILFSITIRENIRLGRLDATDEEIEAAAKMANAHNFIMATTKQYDTPVGERGAQLSGGQKQRIAIARALLRNPKILLLDEATSALDYESEKIVQEALDRAKVGRTTIIIAHRLSTIRNADLIYGLVGGKVAEFGSHDELMEHKGVYHELVTLQTNEPREEREIEEAEEDILSLSKSFERSDSNKFARQFSAKSAGSKHSADILDVEVEVKKKKGFLYLERHLFKYHLPDLMWLIIGCVAQMINGAIFPGQALVFSEIYRIFTIPDPVEQANTSLIFMGILMGLAVIGMITNISYQFAFSLAGARLTKRVRVKMLEAMLRQEITFHDSEENRSSILSTKLAASAPFCKGLTSDKMSLLSQGLAGVGLAVIVAFVINWKLCLVMLVFVPISFGSGVFIGRSNTNTKVKGKLAIEEGGRLTTEVIENIKTVVSLGKEQFFVAEFKSIFNLKFKKTLALLHLQAFFYSLSNSILFFIQAAAFGYGYHLVSTENLAVSSVYKVYATITFSSMILGRVYAQMPDQRKARSAAKDSFNIINRQSKIDSMSEDGVRPEKVVGDIRFINVHFNYPQRPGLKILRGLNLNVKHDETNALVGPSGCGKSTTIALLLRFYDVTSGSITLDGVDIRKLNVQWLRSKIGLVSQEPVLFNFSIKENIMFGDCSRNDISLSEVIDCCIQSNISAKIENLPDKYDTIVGTKGGQLSGGEKQRVAIAPALIRKPKILLLDEATSALDTQSEQIVQETLDKAEKGRTCIVIAHRLSTIQNAHKITVIRDGQVLEEGTHSVLMNNKAFYHQLQGHNN